MRIKTLASVVLILSLSSTVYAVESLPGNLTELMSDAGMSLFNKNSSPYSVSLLSNITTQNSPNYCGVASAVMVLNASPLEKPMDFQHAPFHYFTQENFFNDDVKKIATPEVVQKQGLNLEQMGKIFQSYGFKTQIIYSNKINIDKFRESLKDALDNHQYVIINFLRTALGEQGRGQQSPIAAYDATTDHFLLLDVERYKYPSYWVSTSDLWKAIHTEDKGIYRGFIIIDTTKTNS
jgi:hypothetical protein